MNSREFEAAAGHQLPEGIPGKLPAVRSRPAPPTSFTG